MNGTNRAPSSRAASTHLVLLVTLVLLAAVVLLVPVRPATRLMGMLRDLGHVALGAILAWVLWRVLRQGSRALRPGAAPLLAFCLALLLLTGLELVQPLTGRSASVGDVLAAALGASSTLLIGAALEAPSRSMGALGVLTGLGLLGIALARPIQIAADIVRQTGEMPQLASFEHPAELDRWQAAGTRILRVPDHATDGTWSLEVRYPPGGRHSVILKGALPDWSGYEALAMDLHVDDGGPLRVVLKLEDLVHTGVDAFRSLTTLDLHPGPNRIVLPFAALAATPSGGTLDLRRVAGLTLWVDWLVESRRLWIDDVRLVAPTASSTVKEEGSRQPASPGGRGA